MFFMLRTLRNAPLARRAARARRVGLRRGVARLRRVVTALRILRVGVRRLRVVRLRLGIVLPPIALAVILRRRAGLVLRRLAKVPFALRRLPIADFLRRGLRFGLITSISFVIQLSPLVALLICPQKFELIAGCLCRPF